MLCYSYPCRPIRSAPPLSTEKAECLLTDTDLYVHALPFEGMLAERGTGTHWQSLPLQHFTQGREHRRGLTIGIDKMTSF